MPSKEKTILANPGSIGISFAGVTDKFQIIANCLMIGDRLLGCKPKSDDIAHALEKEGIEATQENIDRVLSFMGEGHK